MFGPLPKRCSDTAWNGPSLKGALGAKLIQGVPLPRVFSLDSPRRAGRPLSARIAQTNVLGPEQSLLDTHGGPSVLDTMDEALSIALNEANPEFIRPLAENPHGFLAFGARTRHLIRLVWDNGEDIALPYLFGGEDGRKLRGRLGSPIFDPARSLWPSGDHEQVAHTLLARAIPRLRALLLLLLAARESINFASTLRIFSADSWRKGTVGMLVQHRESIEQSIPRVAAAMKEQSSLVLGSSLEDLVTLSQTALQIPVFLSSYNRLRLTGLMTSDPKSMQLELRSHLAKMGRTGADYWLSRALKRALHLLEIPEEWYAFLDELLWMAENAESSESRRFAAYEAAYYRDSLNSEIWHDLEQAEFGGALAESWTQASLRAVVEETFKNLAESWYRKPHHAAVNVMRLVVYLRAWPNECSLSVRIRNAISHICHRSAARCRTLDDAYKGRVLRWIFRLLDSTRHGHW